MTFDLGYVFQTFTGDPIQKLNSFGNEGKCTFIRHLDEKIILDTNHQFRIGFSGVEVSKQPQESNYLHRRSSVDLLSKVHHHLSVILPALKLLELNNRTDYKGEAYQLLIDKRPNEQILFYIR